MSKRRIAVIDDDHFVTAHLKRTFRERLPDVEVIGITDPVAPAGFDVYVVDKEFDGNSHGQDVVRRIRAVAPGSLVLAYSAYLDREFLRALLQERCEGAFDKGSLQELDRMTTAIIEFLANSSPTAKRVRGLGGTLRAISGLVHEWNLRLATSGRVAAETQRDV
jgi:DNA-binding NarL/FixJ family response regulator